MEWRVGNMADQKLARKNLRASNVMIVHTLKQAQNSSVLISWLCSMCLSCF
jgi:hypothetical protein